MAASESSGRTQLLEELEELSQSQTRRTTSLVLPRTSVPALAPVDETRVEDTPLSRPPLLRRLSLSSWRSKPKPDTHTTEPETPNKQDTKLLETEEKKPIWSWKPKPIRALSHIGMQKVSCLFSVEVVSVQGLPDSLTGQRLSVCIRKKETRDGLVRTTPTRVSEGTADFEETIYVRCHVYCTPGQVKFEPRPFWIYAFAVDAEELDFGRGSVDLSHLIHESIEKSREGVRVQEWDTSFILLGKAKGAELFLKLGFQILDGGVDIYGQADGFESGKIEPGKTGNSASFSLKKLKTSFSMPTPKLTSLAWTPLLTKSGVDLRGMDELNLNEPAEPEQKIEEPKPNSEPKPEPDDPKPKPEPKLEPEPEPEDPKPKPEPEDSKPKPEPEPEPEEKVEEPEPEPKPEPELLKEIIEDSVHVTSLSEVDSNGQPIKGVESPMVDEETDEMEPRALEVNEESVQSTPKPSSSSPPLIIIIGSTVLAATCAVIPRLFSRT